MPWLDFLFGSSAQRRRRPILREEAAPLTVERLEARKLLDATATLAGGVLTVLGDAANDRIYVALDAARGNLVVTNNGRPVGEFASSGVTSILVDAGDGNNVVRVARDVFQPAQLQAGTGNNALYAGGGTSILVGGNGNNKLVAGSAATSMFGGSGANVLNGGPGPNMFVSGAGTNILFNVQDDDSVMAQPNDRIVLAPNPPPVDPTNPPPQTLEADEVDTLIKRAAGASTSTDGIIAIVDRNGQILGVRVEGGVSPAITANSLSLTFAIDGAVSKARTAAFFANNQAPLTSRTVNFISQSTITQREVESNPNIPDRNSTLYGPGYVAPIQVGGHFPPKIFNTPQVDLFAIEHTNRDSLVVNGIAIPNRFNIPTQFLADPALNLTIPQSYGFTAFAAGDPAHDAQSRGVATLPGGIPIYKNGVLVGGIGVFFPGTTGFASEENSQLSSDYNAALPDRSLEAEYIAFASVGGTPALGAGVGAISGIAPLPQIALPVTEKINTIYLVGIMLDIFGPGGVCLGPAALMTEGQLLGNGTGDPLTGFMAQLNPGQAPAAPNPSLDPTNDPAFAPVNEIPSTQPPFGMLVTPHDGEPNNGLRLTADDVTRIIEQGIAQANETRAAIRLPQGVRTKMVFAVTDTKGNVLGLFRMQDATTFSIDVAVAKARNEAYYANPAELQPIDQLPGVPAGAALTNRTFRYLAEPFFPEGIDYAPVGPFSIYNDGGTNRYTSLQEGPPLPASAFQSVLGFDSFHPGTNFRDPFDVANQNGIVFFPGSVPLYKTDSAGNRVLVGGLGVSGDGVDQDDVVTSMAMLGFQPPTNLTADQFFVQGLRLPYIKYNRNPEG